MFRIDNDTATGSLPTPEAVGPNPDSYFTEGDPGSAIPATVVTADWLNAVQEEISYVIEQAGDTLDKADQTQLKVAIDTMISNALSGTDLLPPGIVYGCTLSNNGTDPTNDIDIATGKAKAASADFDITVASAIGKRIDAVWATAGTPGTTTGGRASAVALAAGWYRVFLIAKTDGTVNAGFDTSATATNLLADATGYTKYRQIGWVYYDGATIRKFWQQGNSFIWDAPIEDINRATSATAQLATLTAPPDVNCEARIVYSNEETSVGGGNIYTLVTATRQTDTAPSATVYNFWYDDDANNQGLGCEMRVFMDSNSQIRTRQSAAAANESERISTLGWVDHGIRP